MKDEKKERRRYPREECETLVRFEGERFSIYSRATNRSNKGAFLATHYLLDPGTPIQLHLLDTTGSKTTRSARVVRTIGRTEPGETCVGIGVEFDEEDPTKVP